MQNSQFRACSANQLSFEKATGSGVVNGVLEITLSISLAGADTSVVESAAKAAVAARTGIDDYTFTYIVSPEGPNFCENGASWCTSGFADTPGEVSVYYNTYATEVVTR